MIGLRRVHFLVMALVIACNLTACGNRGKLKSPSEIEAAEAKKARKNAKAESEASSTAPVVAIPTPKAGD